MAIYEVWAQNDPGPWKHCYLETEDREAAMEKAQRFVMSKRFKYIAVDCDGTTIWSNDPDTPAELPWDNYANRT